MITKTKTTRKPRAKQTPAPVVVNADMNLVAKTIQDYAYAQEDNAREMLAGLFSNPGMMAMMGPPGFAESLVAFTVHKAAEHVLRIEDHARLNPKADPVELAQSVSMARNQYVKALTAARKTLGGDFDRLYEKSRLESNECARINLDSHKGCIYSYVVPKFNDDGTHDPLGPRDFPWGHGPTP